MPKVIVKKKFRNDGYSWGLQFPNVYGRLPQIGWCVWDRHTGEIKYISTKAGHLGESDVGRWSMPPNYYQNPFEYDEVT